MVIASVESHYETTCYMCISEKRMCFCSGMRISTAGLLDVKTLKGTTDSDTFYEFVQTHLLLILQSHITMAQIQIQSSSSWQ